MRKSVLLSFGLISVLLLISNSCKSPVEPDEPELMQHRAEVKVTYNRNPAKITFPAGSDWGVGVGYRLFDPNAEANKLEHEYTEGGTRIGGVRMEKIRENEFVGYIEKVFVQSQSWHGDHMVRMQDPKLYDGVGDISVYTVEGVEIEGAYNKRIVGIDLHFRMSAPGTTRR